MAMTFKSLLIFGFALVAAMLFSLTTTSCLQQYTKKILPPASSFQKSTILFATAPETGVLLTAQDSYKRQLSPTDRQILSVSEKPVDLMTLDRSLNSAGRQFTPAEKSKITEGLHEATQMLNQKGIKLDLPAQIIIAKHDAQIFSGSPYTRANAVFLNDKFIDAFPSKFLAQVLVHEFWHIASRANPVRRAAIYKLVGFTSCSVSLKSLGADVRDKIITNPDTEDFGKFCIDLPDGNTKKRYTNLVMASGFFTGKNFHEVLKPMLVEVSSDGSSVVVDGNVTKLRQIDQEYIKAIGGNGKDEPFHPEEIVAKNLETALTGKASDGSPNLNLANRVASQLSKP
jgi:hypothetical protein